MNKNRWISIKYKRPNKETVTIVFNSNKEIKEIEEIAKQLCLEKGCEFISIEDN